MQLTVFQIYKLKKGRQWGSKLEKAKAWMKYSGFVVGSTIEDRMKKQSNYRQLRDFWETVKLQRFPCHFLGKSTAIFELSSGCLIQQLLREIQHDIEQLQDVFAWAFALRAGLSAYQT